MLTYRALAAIALSLAPLAVATTAVIAQPTTAPTIYCVPGQTHACFAAALSSSGTTATLWLQNLQGSYTADPTPFLVGGIGIQRASAGAQFVWGPAGGEAIPVAEGVVTTPPGTEGFRFFEDSYADDEAFQTRVYSTAADGTGLAGCDLPATDPFEPFFGWSTCVRDGATGWLRLDFTGYISTQVESADYGTFVRAITMADINLTVGDASLNGSLCTIGGAESGVAVLRPCLATPYDLQVVPEPGTVLLMAGGLAALGVGGVVRARRGLS